MSGPLENGDNTHDEWLTDNGFHDQPSAAGLKREISQQLRRRMEGSGLDIIQLAERMQTSRADIERLLDPENDLVSLRAVYRAARSLNCHLVCDLR